MELESFKNSSNKYDKLFFETIEKVFLDLGLEESNKNIFYKTYLEKKQNKYTRQYKEIEGFDGPYRSKYLKGYSPLYRGKLFNTMKETLEAFRKDDFAEGITLNRNGKYTIRRTKKLLDSPTNGSGSIEISWVLNDKKKLDIKSGGNFEKIKIKGVEYFINMKNYKIYNMQSKKVGILLKGQFIQI